ncbi:Uncharacterised protein [uncultured Clostridium sp.]|nr:Uncharacterised protein [uncultured Clostridium sp.]
MAIPASSMPIGPIMLPTVLMVFCSGAGSTTRNQYSSAPAAMAIMLILVSTFFQSSALLPCKRELAWVHSSTSCTMMNAQE